MAFDYETVREVAKAAGTDALIRSLGVLADRNTDDARLRAGVITDELAQRAADDIESTG
jgi:hypothetical protein